MFSNSTSASHVYPFEVVGRGGETQLQMGENVNKITKRFEGQLSLSYIFNNLYICII